MKDSLKKLLKEFPVFLDKEPGSNFYKSSEVLNNQFQGIYQDLYNIYSQLHLVKQLEIWKEQYIENQYTILFKVDLENIKEVNITKNGELIYTVEYSFEEEINKFNYSYDDASLNSIPDDNFVLNVKTWNEYEYTKGFPENDTIENNIYDHNQDIDLLGNYFNIPRKKYRPPDNLLYKTEPPFNTQNTEDDHHYLTRIITYLSKLHTTSLPVLEFFKHYGVWGELNSRKNLIARMNQDVTCCPSDGGSADCKYMRTKNINENVYDFNFDVDSVPSNIRGTDNEDVMKLLQRGMPLTKKVFIQSHLVNSSSTNNIEIQDYLQGEEYYVSKIIGGSGFVNYSNNITVIDNELTGTGRANTGLIDLTGVDYITIDSSYDVRVNFINSHNQVLYSTTSSTVDTSRINSSNTYISIDMTDNIVYSIKLWKLKEYTLEPYGTRHINHIKTIWGNEFNQSVDNLVIDGEDLKLELTGQRGSAVTVANTQIYETARLNSENLLPYTITNPVDVHDSVNGDYIIEDSEYLVDGNLNIYNSVNPLQIQENTPYTFSFFNFTPASDAYVQATIKFYNGNKQLLETMSKTHRVHSQTESRPFITVTSPGGAKYCSFIITSTASSEIYNLMFNKGGLIRYVEGFGEGVPVTGLVGCTKLRITDNKEITDDGSIVYKVYTSNDQENWDLVVSMDYAQLILDMAELKKYIKIKPYFFKWRSSSKAILHSVSIDAW